MKAEKVYIQHLMEKFMDSATSVDEERVLKEYFSAHDCIPEDWSAYAILFRGFSQKSYVANKKRKSVFPWVAAVAASVVCVFLLYINNDYSHNELALTEVGCDTVKTQVPFQEIKEDNTKLLATSVDTKIQSAVKKQPVTLQQQLTDSLDILASDEIDELSDEQIVREYIANNFMRLDEKMLIEEPGEIITMCQNNQSEHSLASDEIDELSDEQIVREYIANNFMSLDEKMLIEEPGEIITMCQNNQSEHSEYLNGLGQMVNIEDYDF